MNRSLLLFAIFLLFTAHALGSEPTYELTESPMVTIKDYKVVPDRNYSFKKISSHTSIKSSIDSMNPKENGAYWIRLTFHNPYPIVQKYVFQLSLPLNYTLVTFDHQRRKWTTRNAGPSFASESRENGLLTLTFSKQSTQTYYLKVNLKAVQGYRNLLKPNIVLEKEELRNGREALMQYHLWICCIVLLSFIGYNFYLFIYLKDKGYLHFMVSQIGSIIFLCGARHYVNLITELRIYNIRIVSNNAVYFYDLNKLFQHIGIFLVVMGLAQFTRVFLGTGKLLPRYDKVLKYMVYGYATLVATSGIITISGLFYLDYYTIVFENLYLQLILLTMIWIGISAYRKKIRAAGYFLFANIIPLVLVVASSAYAILNHRVNPVLPELAIFFHVLTFGVALIARIKIVNEELNEKRVEAIKMESQIKISEYQHLLIDRQKKEALSIIETEKNRNNMLTEELQVNQREMIGNNMYIHQKNILLSDLAKQVKDINRLHPDLKSEALHNIQSSLRDDHYLEAQWDKFKFRFEQVHPLLFDNLKAKYSNLTQNDLRLYAYMHINLSTKEIAMLLHIEPSSVKKAKFRLNKKMGGELSKSYLAN